MTNRMLFTHGRPPAPACPVQTSISPSDTHVGWRTEGKLLSLFTVTVLWPRKPSGSFSFTYSGSGPLHLLFPDAWFSLPRCLQDWHLLIC